MDGAVLHLLWKHYAEWFPIHAVDDYSHHYYEVKKKTNKQKRKPHTFFLIPSSVASTRLFNFSESSLHVCTWFVNFSSYKEKKLGLQSKGLISLTMICQAIHFQSAKPWLSYLSLVCFVFFSLRCTLCSIKIPHITLFSCPLLYLTGCLATSPFTLVFSLYCSKQLATVYTELETEKINQILIILIQEHPGLNGVLTLR